MTPNQTEYSFDGLGIAPALREVIGKLGFTKPTPIQYQSIPVAVEGKDIIGIAQTGTGKTLAFGLPMIQRLALGGSQGLILVPTRELALQIEETMRKVGSSLGVRTAVLIGGAPMFSQIKAMRANPHVIIATPGRLTDHLNQRIFTLGKVNIVVLDEADRMLDMGFLPQIKKILALVPKDRQSMLFSATLSNEIMSIATSHMKLPVRIEIAPQGSTAERVTQEIFIVPKASKPSLLEKVLTEYRGSTLIFTRTKHGAKRITKTLRAHGHTAAEIHSNRSLNQRKEALEGFKKGKYRILVATDIASRGIDVTGIELVINYDLPTQTSDYVHRIGRTARAGAAGHAISFALPEERRDIRDIERLTKKALPVSQLPQDLPKVELIAAPFEDSRRSHFSSRRSSTLSHNRSQNRSRFGNRFSR